MEVQICTPTFVQYSFVFLFFVFVFVIFFWGGGLTITKDIFQKKNGSFITVFCPVFCKNTHAHTLLTSSYKLP